METAVVMPQLGNEIEEALVDGWMKAVGDKVSCRRGSFDCDNTQGDA